MCKIVHNTARSWVLLGPFPVKTNIWEMRHFEAMHFDFKNLWFLPTFPYMRHCSYGFHRIIQNSEIQKSKFIASKCLIAQVFVFTGNGLIMTYLLAALCTTLHIFDFWSFFRTFFSEDCSNLTILRLWNSKIAEKWLGNAQKMLKITYFHRRSSPKMP